MIEIGRHTLSNGLKIVHNREVGTKMAAVNLLYQVGAKDENPNKTGFAHLMEHLMFSGTQNVPDFDSVLRLAGGENNAWTTADLTNYYDVIPVNNIETAFCLEADRMVNLALSDEAFEAQRSVVAEEFKQRCLNVPYGDLSHIWRALVYKNHPYRWPAIGLRVEDIENACKADILSLYNRFYAPNNAILSVVGDVDFDTVVRLAEKWFGNIPAQKTDRQNCISEPPQTEKRSQSVCGNVPHKMIFKVFRMGDRLSQDYAACDLMSDLLSNGRSSRFFKKFLSQGYLFSNIDASITGELEDGTFRVQASLLPDVSFEEAEAAIDSEIADMQNNLSDYELTKFVNKFESNKLFTNINIDERAANIAYFEMLGNANLINTEICQYRSITGDQLKKCAAKLFRKENSSVVYYSPIASED